jgi:hypothetical protein
LATRQDSQPTPDPVPVTITFVPDDPVTHGIVVKHDGKIVWSDATMSSWEQYIRQKMPQGVPVVLLVE